MANIIQKLIDVRQQKSELEAAESELIEQIIAESGHKKLGAATYKMSGFKLMIKTDETINLDKSRLNVEWTEDLPINRSYAYTIRKKDFEAEMKHGSSDRRKFLSEIVTTKPAKPYVKIEF